MKTRSLVLSPLLALILTTAPLAATTVPETARPGQPALDAPQKTVDRATGIRVISDGSDTIGARLATRLRERFNQSSLFKLNSEEDKDAPELRLLLTTAPEFPSRPSVGSIYGVCWVFSQGKGYLSFLLAREIGTVNSDDLDGIVDKLVDRTDGIAAKYANLWKQ
ncbi:MAG: hypothetical protein K2H64_11000 [Desulfovibrio sp.]|nr:hypothetical protein [Desulfovibrio sp.]